MQIDINDMRNEFFKKSIAPGHHNVLYDWQCIVDVILGCVRSLTSVEEGADAPSAQTIRDRLRLDGDWLEHFHECMWQIATGLVRLHRFAFWHISIDETHTPFFGNRKKLNAWLEAHGLGRRVLGYRCKTPGATGSFGFLVVSLCCGGVRLPLALFPLSEGERYEPLLEPVLQRLLTLVPRAIVLADRGFAYTQFFRMLERLRARFVVRLPLHSKTLQRKVTRGQRRMQYWMTDSKTKEKVLLSVRVMHDTQQREYVVVTSEPQAKDNTLLTWYRQRWDIENLFKDADRVLLPTSSRNPLMRLFCVALSFLLFALWQAERRLHGGSTSLRSFVKRLLPAFRGPRSWMTPQSDPP